MATPAISSFGSNQQEHGLSAPTCEPILAIHRGKDSYVTFHKMQDVVAEDKKRKLVLRDCCVRAESLRNVFPQFIAEFDANEQERMKFSLLQAKDFQAQKRTPYMKSMKCA
jgi:hypothetical protein